ncbi:MAG: hypothetical protein OM95_05925 [Bdellovibrio sp. ArHS]|nr:MAG: hypothetical protein OM95_05925 [Bdellovibrio sp. ArHS]
MNIDKIKNGQKISLLPIRESYLQVVETFKVAAKVIYNIQNTSRFFASKINGTSAKFLSHIKIQFYDNFATESRSRSLTSRRYFF